ncbi:hypothetical protein ACXYMU_16530 [Pontibacter sp. CAU 1760]
MLKELRVWPKFFGKGTAPAVRAGPELLSRQMYFGRVRDHGRKGGTYPDAAHKDKREGAKKESLHALPLLSVKRSVQPFQ